MLPRRFTAALALVSAVAALVAVACEKVPLLAPTGSTITLTAPVTTLSANGTTTVIAQVLEAAGTPPHSGTHVTFTTNLGRIVPAEAQTDSSGRAVVTFMPGGVNGQATITAISGGASVAADNALKIAVGTAAVGAVSLSATPSSVSANGGSTTIAARIIDLNGNALVGAAVTFTTSAGSLSALLGTTDVNGVVTTVLTTSLQATVTASVGAASSGGGSTPSTGTNTASITVNVTNGPTVSIAPPATITKGTPANFTFTVNPGATNGAPIRNVVVNWGDGVTRDLGAITGASTQSHQYNQDGPFLITVTATDTSGAQNTSSASINVLTIPEPTLTITVPATIRPNVPALFTFTAQPGSPTVPLRTLTVNWGDGSVIESFATTSGASQHSHTYSTVGNFTVTATVVDAAGTSSSSSASAVVTVP